MDGNDGARSVAPAVIRAWIAHKRMIVRNLAYSYGRGRRFKKFEASLHPQTWARHEELLEWAEEQVAAAEINEAPERYEASLDPVVLQGFQLRSDILAKYRGSHSNHRELRVLVHIPPPNVSSAYASLCENLRQGLQFLGISAARFWNESTAEVLNTFQPTLLLTTDHPGYLAQIDWKSVEQYRASRPLRVALNASLQEYGNTPLEERLEWARQHDIDFYYSFKTQEYVGARYQAILGRGYHVPSVEFGANPLLYYPVPGIARDLNYVFLGSTNPEKAPRYFQYFRRIWRQYPGYIDGPWWTMISRFGSSETHRYLCARARVALNLHIQTQIKWAGELNERAYNLAACGVPQIVDAPKILSARFSDDSFFVARTPVEYEAMFVRALKDPEEAQRRALQAQREVFARHTIFHRLEQFLVDLREKRLIEASQ